MNISLTKIAASLAVAVAMTAASALPSRATTVEELRERGFARVAIHNEPPYAYMTMDGTAAGVGPEVVTAVLKRLGIEQIDWIVTPFSTLIPGL